MRGGRALVACLLAIVAGGAAGRARASPVELEGPEHVQGVLFDDVDGDGARDVLLLTGRSVYVFPGRPGALPTPAPRWVAHLAEDVSYVDAIPGGDGPPALLALGRGGTRRVALADGTEHPLPEASTGLDWADWQGATFADLVLASGAALLPLSGGPETGWRYHATWRLTSWFQDLAVPAFVEVGPPGTFLEDTGMVTSALPRVWIGPAPRGAPAGARPTLWALGGGRLVAVHGGHRAVHDVSFLPRGGVQQLVDLDGDGAPEVVHREGTNRESTIAVFAPPPLALDGGRLAPRPPDLRPPACVIRLTGFVVNPDFVDLDGDGRQDFTVTTIPIDARNTIRALGGVVTASTRAFLGRDPAGGRRFFAATPDASVVSDIGVAIRFSQAGNLDIRRSFTILTRGDFDGDGRRDLAIRTGPETITIRRGTGSGVWAGSGRAVSIPPPGASPDVDGYAADVTGDGRDELVLLYRRPYAGRDRIWVVKP